MTTTLAIADQNRLPPATVVLDYAPQPRGRLVWTVLNFALMLAIIGSSIYYGLIIRRVAWEDAYQVHFRITMNSAIKWGLEANRVGILNVYQETLDDDGDDLHREPGDGRLALDYPPLRMLVIAKWEAWTEQLHAGAWSQPAAQRARLGRYARNPRVPIWVNEYEFNQPMLELNTACEFAGAVAMFLLVHYWLRQCSGAPARQWIDPLRCAWPALFSALLVWFSPALIFNAHSYPQWDAWIVAPFLLAIYFGMLDLWLISGILIGAVSMGKGQILLVVPVLVIWQLLMLRGGEILRLSMVVAREGTTPPLLEILRLLVQPLGVVLRLGVGIMLAISLVASPWLTGDPIAQKWMIWLAVGLCVLSALFFVRKWSPTYLYIQGGIFLAALFMILWPWIKKPRPDFFGWTFLAFIGFAIAARFLPRRWAFSWAATAIAAALFACVPLYNTSMAWYTIGIKFPTEHWQLLYWCHAMNLGAILNKNFHWEFDDTLNLADYLPFIHTHFYEVVNHFLSQLGCDGSLPFIPMRYLMIAAYFVSIFLCAIGMAIHTRRKDRMFFFAMVAPWVLMYALLPQMQNRYSVWAAAFAAATASFSLDGFMLFLLLNALNFVDTAWDMLYRAQGTQTAIKWMPLIGRDPYGQPVFGGIGPLFPDLGWAALLIAGIYLYLSLRRDRRSRSPASFSPAPPTLFALPSPGGLDVIEPQAHGAIV